MGHLAAEGFPASSEVSGTVALLVGELAANAARHGRVSGHVPDRVPSHEFRLRLAVAPDRGGVRIEVIDASPALPPTVPRLPSPTAESGRGLPLVTLFAARWGTDPHPPTGKTVWAEVSTAPSPSPASPMADNIAP
ncbi:ATP-binding protein [Streptomyces sp. ST2-7A]|nr:ATP-binding protein [Streptomyces sp. ST2-7A]